ncbi:2-C-methyl-D-erythritol 2,4-cyclodiphosphate synthase [Mariniplasma anaerobium]|uniref:2-C-methyl-D-erythritol 2,4-cyclodiphosphate synthase n=1 Tax=Mariniplasma anaerobium TaxID=2735436 RepID=A0A7U9XUY4_9MOLU|nr:2-C-methyl-D-erythritol 2,4-cyclodiphosphate synthase [Mariniplasma anaerobium]BCR35140.1 bifunctional enzyme IspD/IspF [Mariniplasma anaerobium]
MNTALIVAAGTGSRSQLKISKILYKINDKPIFMYSVDLFKSLGFEICLVIAKNDMKDVIQYVDPSVKIVIGGKTRSESVQRGLKEVTTPYVYIHDAARPLITKKAILNMENALQNHDAVMLSEPVTSALKYNLKQNITSVNRDDYLLSQTPQAFLTEKIRYASLRNQESFDDDISLYQSFYQDASIHVIHNDEPNPKLTYLEDFTNLKYQLEGDSNMRIGHSFDIHQLKEDRKLILGGLTIEHDKGLDGHSDADVLTHAIAEALLGALALGDLGSHYPDNDSKYKDISSIELLKDVYQKIKALSYEIINIDSTVYAELPKLNPYITEMRKKISETLDIDISKVSIKATTYEKLDAIGNQKAIAAEAITLLKKVNV